jgi:hypothetical protein
MRRPGRLIFLLALSPRRRLEDALKTLLLCVLFFMHSGCNLSRSEYVFDDVYVFIGNSLYGTRFFTLIS